MPTGLISEEIIKALADEGWDYKTICQRVFREKIQNHVAAKVWELVPETTVTMLQSYFRASEGDRGEVLR